MPDAVNPASITSPFSCMARAIRSLCNDVGRQGRAAECSALRAVSATSPPPVRHHSSTTPLLLMSSFIAVALFCHLPPSNRCWYVCLAESSGLTADAGSELPLSRSSQLPWSLGVPLLPLLPLSTSASPPSGREKRPHPCCTVKDGRVIRLQSRGRHRHRR